MKILFCASEVFPFAKTGGMADVCGALPLELERSGHEVVVVMPHYRQVLDARIPLFTLNERFDRARIGENLHIYFLKSDMYLRVGLYGDESGDYSDNITRFAHFCSGVLDLLSVIDFVPDIVHCHDWQTALIPLYLKEKKVKLPKGCNPKTLFTIHNLAYQGVFARDLMPETKLSEKYFSISGLEFFDQVNLLKGGIQFADMINTVSPTYCKDIQTKKFGCGLEGVLKARKKILSGIINGVDYKIWNPQGDSLIFKPYSARQALGKKENKLRFQKACGLTVDEKMPLLGFVGRLVEQKGIDLLIESLPKLCSMGCQLVLLGDGQDETTHKLQALAKQYAQLVYILIGFDETIAHRIYAASDIFLMPSRFEPCGLGQLIAFKYGSVPVVHKTGGLADTVIDYNRQKKTGSGFTFMDYDSESLTLAIQRACEVFANQEEWTALIEKNMKLNFSWKESAKKYTELYERMMSLS